VDFERGTPPGPGDAPAITEMLVAWRGGDQSALDRLVPAVYDHLRRIARRQLGRERSGHTLSATGLVHEAYLKLVDQTRVQWADRAHFYAVAARAMRRILVDHARRHRTAKRGGDRQRVSLEELDLEQLDTGGVTGVGADAADAADASAERLIALDDALARLALEDERLARIVECRFFGGLTEDEAAEALGVSARTVRREWVKAKAWLYRAMRE
jgi:RNA polymerase sigma factor (TIGR02999 family)